LGFWGKMMTSDHYSTLLLWDQLLLASICGNMWYLSFWAWFVSLTIMFFSSINIATNNRISFFLWLNNIPVYILPDLFYPFLWQWALSLIPYFSFYEYCCHKDESTGVSSIDFISFAYTPMKNLNVL
jgi:hypothetical protein